MFWGSSVCNNKKMPIQIKPEEAGEKEEGNDAEANAELGQFLDKHK